MKFHQQILFDLLHQRYSVVWNSQNQHRLDSIDESTQFMLAIYNTSCDDQTKFNITRSRKRNTHGLKQEIIGKFIGGQRRYM